MQSGTLFTSDFLIEGIRKTGFWRAIEDSEVHAFREKLATAFSKFPANGSPNESTTERDLIDHVIEALGWADYLTQQTASQKGRSDVPDYLLFTDPEQKRKANAERNPADRYRHGLAILEAKAWLIPLDRKIKTGLGEGVPSNQILRYLNLADIQSDGAIKWGILTNGRDWRLYYQNAKSRSEEFLSLDLPMILGLVPPDLFDSEELERQDWLRVFYAMFRREAFIKQGAENLSFHQVALREGRYWEEHVAADLSDIVFREVFPELARSLAQNDPQKPEDINGDYLSELRQATLILLYRLLFLLYAEDRNLLPVNDSKYGDYGLRKRTRDDIRKRIDGRDVFSSTLANYYHHVIALCGAVDRGDASIGLPPYNGGLFDPARAVILHRSEIPDSAFAPLFDKLSRRYQENKRAWINYRDLSVQQLGSIYERFLEYELEWNEGGGIGVRLNIFSRKTTGSFYTPEPLVNLIIQKTAGPLIDERVEAFRKKAAELKGKRNPKPERLKSLAPLDPASQILKLRICDPAMGSGHFLVSLVDYLADRMLILIEDAPALVDWTDEKHPYVSPLTETISSIREHILAEAKEHGWIVREEQLDDRHIVRRMILKRCVFGVDKNPMAVELAKVSLWLHTFTVGAPLSFLDHHLRCGDSLFGEFTHDVERELRERGSMFISSEVAKAKATAKGMARIESLTDADIAEVKESASVFKEVSKGSRPLTRFYDVIHALRWIDVEDKNRQTAVNAFFDQTFGNPVHMAAESELAEQPGSGKSNGTYAELVSILRETHGIAGEEGFLHWEIAFPMVWNDWESEEPDGGFDAVIGNPPWDRIKLQEVEWFAARKPEIALSARASDRKKMIERLEKSGDPLWLGYQKAVSRAKSASDVASSIGHYPLLSKGDINLYSLFVERAHRLVKPEGFVGLLTPSGIASDKGASEFFKTIATSGRLGSFYDFENKKVFFRDIDSRFKFSVYVAGGKSRRFDRAEMAFFLHAVGELNDQDRVFQMRAVDFERVNPNTCTAPIFRTRRDAEITRRIYAKFPVLVHHANDGSRKDAVWPVKYLRMFDMTNDSHLFKTREELEQDGFYPVAGNRMKKGKVEFVPLYEGKMVQAYDHRAASVVVNLKNLNRPGQPEPATSNQRANAKWLPKSQYWVDLKNIELSPSFNWYIAFKEITASTNMRTMIATIIPRYGANNKLPVFVPVSEKKSTVDEYKKASPLFCANLNAFAFDFVVRQKVHSTTLNLFIVEQLPVIPPEKFEAKIGKKKISDLIRDHVLQLTYTAHDMKPFARDMGYNGEPFAWDEDERRHLRARLDALFFLLYEINRDDAAYIMDTFPIVKEKDEREFGRYITRDLIMGYMSALSADDVKSKITIP